MNYAVGIGVRASAAAAALSRSVNLESSAVKVYEIDPLHDSRWEDFVSRHPDASVFHSTHWLVTSRW